MWLAQASESNHLGFKSFLHLLAESPRQVNSLLWMSVFPSVRWTQWGSVALLGRLKILHEDQAASTLSSLISYSINKQWENNTEKKIYPKSWGREWGQYYTYMRNDIPLFKEFTSPCCLSKMIVCSPQHFWDGTNICLLHFTVCWEASGEQCDKCQMEGRHKGKRGGQESEFSFLPF